MAKGNIQDFVRDGTAWFRCTQCGAETTIIKWDFDIDRRIELVNHDKTAASIQAFVAQHTLCKPPSIQTALFPEEKENG